jgi:MFS transporter, PAT family, beta-lactamase induction signal transducer AmpG
MATRPTLLAVFEDRKMAYLMLLGFSSGLPLYLTGPTLQAWLTVDGVDYATIGLLSLVALPYSLKFLWSPLLDRFTLPILGRRRGWIAASQVLLLGAIAAMALGRPEQSVALLAALALTVAFLSATQDIAIDAYRADVLTEREMGAGAGVTVFGYRIAMILAGGGAVALADFASWPRVYLVMAGCMLIGLAAAARAPEPDRPGTPPTSLTEAVARPFGEFWRRHGSAQPIAILAFIAVYKLGDNVVGNMTTTFLVETGFSLTEIGLVRGVMGVAATIAGVLVGGAFLSRLGILRALWVFGLIQAATNILYLALAEAGRNMALMIGTVNLEYFAQGLGTSALVAFLMSLCNRRFTATQYALLSSFMAISRDLGSSPSGIIAQATGWPLFFLISIVLAIPGLALVRWISRQPGAPGTPEPPAPIPI